MKKILFLSFLLMLTLGIRAQDNEKNKSSQDSDMEEFYLGHWKLLVEGLPQGDSEMLLTLEKANGKLQGTIGGVDGETMTNLTKIKIEGKTLSVNFIGAGWDVAIYLDKQEDGTVSGSLNDMFDVTGNKVVE